MCHFVLDAYKLLRVAATLDMHVCLWSCSPGLQNHTGWEWVLLACYKFPMGFARFEELRRSQQYWSHQYGGHNWYPNYAHMPCKCWLQTTAAIYRPAILFSSQFWIGRSVMLSQGNWAVLYLYALGFLHLNSRTILTKKPRQKFGTPFLFHVI